MIKNQKLEEMFEKLGIPNDEGYAFCILLHYKQHEFLIRKNLIDPEKCMLLVDVLDGEYVLKYPLFKTGSSKWFTSFIGKLQASGELNAMGHVNNPQKYAVLDTSETAQEEFDKHGLKTDEAIDKAVLVVINYYKQAELALKLSNYLMKNFKFDYDSY